METPLLAPSERRSKSALWLSLVSLWALGINFGWSALFVLAAPRLKSLGLSSVATSAAWLAGPLSGLIVQPIVGLLSDQSQSRLGRRRPFIVAGTLLSVLGMLMFGNSLQIGVWFGDTATHRVGAIAVSVLSLWVLNIGLNIVQSSAWAMTLDLCANEHEAAVGTAAVTALSAGGTFAANLLGYCKLQQAFPFFASDAQALFYIGLVILVLSMIAPILVVKEAPFVAPLTANGDVAHSDGALRKYWRLLRTTPREVYWLLAAYFCSSAAITPFLFYFTDYVFNGVADSNDAATRQLYNDGVQFGSLCMAVMAALTLLYSLALPALQRAVGVKGSYLLGQALGVVALLLPMLLRTRVFCVVVVLFLSALNATYGAVPFVILTSLTGGGSEGTNNGYYIGIMNVAQVAAQMIANLLAGGAMSLTDTQFAGFGPGVFFALLGLPAIFFLQLQRAAEAKE